MLLRLPSIHFRPTADLIGMLLRAPMFALCLSAVASNTYAAGPAIYKSVDSNGNTVFTDQPLKGAESLNDDGTKPPESDEPLLGEAEPVEKDDSDGPEGFATDGVMIAPDPVNPPKSTYKEPVEATEFLPVTVVELLTPIHDATLQDPIGQIWVEFQSYPTPLVKAGLTAQLWMDEQLIASGKRNMLSLPPPERGTHILRIKLVDDKGRLFLESAATHIHVRYRVAGQ